MAATDKGADKATEKKRGSAKPPRRGGASSSFSRLANAQAAAGQQTAPASETPAGQVLTAVPGQPATGQPPAPAAAPAMPFTQPPAAPSHSAAAAVAAVPAPAPPAPEPAAEEPVRQGGRTPGAAVPSLDEFLERVEANRNAAAAAQPATPDPRTDTGSAARAGDDRSGWAEANEVINAGVSAAPATIADTHQRPEPDGGEATAELVRLVLQLPAGQNQADAATKGTNVQAPGRVIKLLKKEAVKPVTHAQVIFRAVDGAVKDPEGFTRLLREWQTRNAEQSMALGLYSPAESLRASGTERLQYNPPMWFERQLRNLAGQCGLSKAVFVSLCLVHRYQARPGIDVSII